MKKLLSIFLLVIISCNNLQNDLIGTWKIDKVQNSEGLKIDSSNFAGETFIYHEDGTVEHNNPSSPIEEFKKQSGKWELKNDTLYQFNKGEKRIPFQIEKLSKKELIVNQKTGNITTTIHFIKAK